MWRASHYDEDWERRKSYLLRSYFEDIPRLTTISERGESSESSSDLPYRPPRYYDRHTANNRPDSPLPRPESPLPDLIIEKEPKRNVHDEPEEFYQRLEIKVKRYIKKLAENKTSSIDYDTDSCSTVIIDNEIERISQKRITDEETNESTNNAVESDNDTMEENKNYHSEAENATNINTNSNKSIGSTEKTIPNEEFWKGDIVGNKSSQSPTFTEIAQRHSSSTDSTHEVLIMQVQAEVHAENEPRDFFSRSNMILRYDDSNNNRRTSNSSDLSDPSNKPSSRASKQVSFSDDVIDDETDDLVKIDENISVKNNAIGRLNSSEISRDSHSLDNQIETMRGHTPIPERRGSIYTDNASGVSETEDNASFRENLRKRLTSSEISRDSHSIDNQIETMRGHTPIPERRGSIYTDNASGVSETEDNASFRENLRKRRTFSLPQNDGIDEELQGINNEDELNPLESNVSMNEDILRCSTSQDKACSPFHFKSPSPPKRKRTLKDVCTQTSFTLESGELTWDNIKNYLFVGTPKIFKLCKCRNHTCV